jgi:hypothetical protein
MVIGQLKDILVHLQLKKMIREWRKLEEKLQKLEKNKHSFRMHIADWHHLEAEAKNWITGHRNSGSFVSTKMIIFKVRRWVFAHSITDFAGTTSWLVGSLFYDAFSVTGLYSIDNRVISE